MREPDGEQTNDDDRKDKDTAAAIERAEKAALLRLNDDCDRLLLLLLRWRGFARES